MSDRPTVAPRARPRMIDFEGRVRRLPFAIAAVFIGSIMPLMIDILALCAKAVGVPIPAQDVPTALHSFHLDISLALPIALLVGLALVTLALVLVSFQVRRLHDVNVLGWFVLAFLLLRALPVPDFDPAPSLRFLIWIGILAAMPGQSDRMTTATIPRNRYRAKHSVEEELSMISTSGR